MTQQTHNDSTRRGWLVSLTPLVLFSVGMSLYLWCMFTHWCIGGHLAHNQTLGIQTDIAWKCVFAVCGALCWVFRYKYLRLLWLLLALLTLWSFLWVNLWWLGRWSLLIMAALVMTIYGLLISDMQRYRRRGTLTDGGLQLGDVVLALTLLLNGLALGAMFFQYDRIGRNMMQPDARQTAIKQRIEQLGGKALFQQGPWSRFHLYGAWFQNVPITDRDLDFLSAFPEIRDLDLSGTLVTDAGMANLLPLRSLNRVSLARTRVTDKGTEFLRRMTGYHMVIDLSDTEIGDRTVANLPTSDVIFNLDLRRTRITDSGMAVLAGRTNEIWDLFLQGTHITDEGLRQFVTARVTRSLDLRNTSISDAGVAALAAMGKRQENVREFELGGSGVSSNGAKRLYDECYGYGVEVNTGYWIKTFGKE